MKRRLFRDLEIEEQAEILRQKMIKRGLTPEQKTWSKQQWIDAIIEEIILPELRKQNQIN